jgi:cold shock protein
VTTTIYGTVHFWNEEKNWGVLRRNDFKRGDKDDFIHVSALERAGIRVLKEGDAVEYELMPDKRHPEWQVVTNIKMVQ